MADCCLGGLAVMTLTRNARDWGEIPYWRTEFFSQLEPTVTFGAQLWESPTYCLFDQKCEGMRLTLDNRSLSGQFIPKCCPHKHDFWFLFLSHLSSVASQNLMWAQIHRRNFTENLGCSKSPIVPLGNVLFAYLERNSNHFVEYPGSFDKNRRAYLLYGRREYRTTRPESKPKRCSSNFVHAMISMIRFGKRSPYIMLNLQAEIISSKCDCTCSCTPKSSLHITHGCFESSRLFDFSFAFFHSSSVRGCVGASTRPILCATCKIKRINA